MNILFVDSTASFSKDSTKPKSVLDSEKRAFAAKAWRAKKKKQQLLAARKSAASNSDGSVERPEKSQNSWCFSSPLSRGNSDPFCVAAIEIDPVMSSHITLMRDVVTPAHFSTPIMRACSRVGMLEPRESASRPLVSDYSKQKYWKIASEVLYDAGPAAAYKVVASGFITGGVGWVTKPWSSIEELEMRSRAILSLRRSIEQNTPDSDFGTYQQFYFLIKLEIATSRYEDSYLHRQTLRRAVERAFENGVLNIENFSAIGLAMMDMAPKTMQRPIFDVDVWCHKIFSPQWLNTRAILRARGVNVRKEALLHPCIEISNLVAAFLEAWIHIDTAKAMASSETRWSKEDEDHVYMYIITTSHVTSGRLVNLFLDLNEPEQLQFAHMKPVQRQIQACLALALLYCLRILEHECIVKGIDIRDVADSVLTHMHSTFKLIKASPGIGQQVESEALLWIAFIGTIYELRRKAKQTKVPYTSCGNEMFSHYLQEIAVELDVHSFESLREISEKFFYTGYLIPSGSSEFDVILAGRTPELKN